MKTLSLALLALTIIAFGRSALAETQAYFARRALARRWAAKARRSAEGSAYLALAGLRSRWSARSVRPVPLAVLPSRFTSYLAAALVTFVVPLALLATILAGSAAI